MDWPGASRLCLFLPPQLWVGKCTLVPTSSSWHEPWGWNSGAQLCSATPSPMALPLAGLFSIGVLCRSSQVFLKPFRVRVGLCLPASLKTKNKKRRRRSPVLDLGTSSHFFPYQLQREKKARVCHPGCQVKEGLIHSWSDCVTVDLRSMLEKKRKEQKASENQKMKRTYTDI